MKKLNAIEMPKYTCHKEVWALKIKKIEIKHDENADTLTAMITPNEKGYAPFGVDEVYLNKHEPKEGGYYVVYKDGYKSFSPSEVFLSGYSLNE